MDLNQSLQILKSSMLNLLIVNYQDVHLACEETLLNSLQANHTYDSFS